jgi:hypothetical protein
MRRKVGDNYEKLFIDSPKDLEYEDILKFENEDEEDIKKLMH